MVLPVVARNRVTDKYSGSTLVRRHVQVGWAQARPIDRVMPYNGTLMEASRFLGTLNIGDASTLSHPPPQAYASAMTAGWNRSYSKLVEGLGGAELGTNIVEYRQARDMIGTRGREALGLLYLLLRGKFATAGRAFGCSFFEGRPPKKGRSKWILPDYAKKSNISLSNLYLQWHFGVDPLVKDVQGAAAVLTDQFPSKRLSGSSQEYLQHLVYADDPANPGTYSEDRWDMRVRTRQGCVVHITNPNLALANQLGLLNPAALAWEIVPFSFVADWFVNVGDWLQGFSDFAGMTLDSVWSTSHLWSWHARTRAASGAYGTIYGQYITVARTTNLVGPSLSFKPLKLPSMTRVATIWSLVSQLVQRHR